MQVARVNLIDWHAIGQQPFARLARTRQVKDAVIARCQGWIAEHYDEPSPVSAMARLTGLAERSFKRRFGQATGLSPLEYVHTLRIEKAKQMLESGDQPIEAIANAVGYDDAGFFSRLFRRKVKLTPAQYRKRFGGMHQALQADLVAVNHPSRRNPLRSCPRHRQLLSCSRSEKSGIDCRDKLFRGAIMTTGSGYEAVSAHSG